MGMTVYPLVVAYGFQKDDKYTFILPGREVTIEGADTVLGVLLPQCNGYNSLNQILELMKEKTGCVGEDLAQLINTLLEKRILVDVSSYYQLYHEISANRMPFVRDLTEEKVMAMLHGESPLVCLPSEIRFSLFEELLEKRASTREFNGEPILQEELLRLAWAIYGRIERSDEFVENTSIGFGTVPSGGALYPLRLFSFILKGASPLRKGVYGCGSQGMIWKGSVDEKKLEAVFLGDQSVFKDAAAILVLVCDFWQTVQKYSNLGYRFALLEAGHAAQNAYLWCTEQGLGIVEVGAFNDKELASVLSLDYPKQAPLCVLILGRRKTNNVA